MSEADYYPAGSAVQQSRLSDELWVLPYKEGGVVSLKGNSLGWPLEILLVIYESLRDVSVSRAISFTNLSLGFAKKHSRLEEENLNGSEEATLILRK